MRRAASVVVAGAGLILVAFTFDAAPLFVAGVAFVVVGVVAPVWVLMAGRQIRVRRDLTRERVIEGEPVEATVVVDRGRLGIPGAELHDPLAGAPVSLSLPLSLIRGQRRVRVRVVARFARRGLHRLEPPTVIVHDPMGLTRFVSVGRGAAQEVLVLPATEPIRWGQAQPAQRSEHAGGRAMAEPFAAVDIDGLRPYRTGTPASRIHWAALARGAGLLERRLREDGDVRPLVIVDPRGDGPVELLDAAVRAAASLTLELARVRGCRLLLPGDRRGMMIQPDLVGWPRAHVQLAMVEGGPRASAPALEPTATLGTVFYVAARSLRQPPGALCTDGPSPKVLVLPRALCPNPELAVFEVAGCCGLMVRLRASRSWRTAA